MFKTLKRWWHWRKVKGNEESDKEWAQRHGIVGAILYDQGLKKARLRELWGASKRDFNKYLQMLKNHD